MNRQWIAAAAIVALLARATLHAEPPAVATPQAVKTQFGLVADGRQFVTVEFTVFEVNRTKLRTAGFDWFDESGKEHLAKLLNDPKQWGDLLRRFEQSNALSL